MSRAGRPSSSLIQAPFCHDETASRVSRSPWPEDIRPTEQLRRREQDENEGKFLKYGSSGHHKAAPRRAAAGASSEDGSRVSQSSKRTHGELRFVIPIRTQSAGDR